MPYMVMVSRDRETNGRREWSPTDLIFDDGTEAGAYVKQENSYQAQHQHRWGGSYRYKVSKITDDDPLAWRYRAEKSFTDGEWKKPPWHDRYGSCGLWEHIDPNDGTKIRYILNDEHGREGRFTTMTPGRFIRRYLDTYCSNDLIDKYCAAMGLDETVSDLKIGRTVEEFIKVYTEGPHSCMSYKFDPDEHPFMEVGIQPVTAYGDSDLGVAYIERHGEITARCLVWPDKKKFGRIYGDRHRLLERLKENGYIEDWEFVGAKIRQIRSNGYLVLPYLDGEYGVIKDGDDWLLLSDKPHIIGKSPNGMPSAAYCSKCEAEDVWLHDGKDDDDDEPYYICAEGCKK